MEYAIAAVVQMFAVDASIVVCHDDARARYQLLYGAEESDTPLIFVARGRDEVACRAVFSLHVNFRRPDPNLVSWHGGLIVIAVDPAGLNALREQDLYQDLAGHVVLPSPLSITDLLTKLESVGHLYPRQWQIAVERSGLKAFWDFIEEADLNLQRRAFEECKSNLKRAMRQVVDEGVLKRLVPHVEVMRKMESLNKQFDSDCVHENEVANLILEVRSVMSGYVLGK